MQADRRFVKDEQRIFLSLSHLAGEFEPLGFSAGKAGRFLAQGEIAKPQFREHFQSLPDELHVATVFHGIIDVLGHQLRQGEGPSVLGSIADLVCLFSIPGSATVWTGDFDIREELDIQADRSRPVAGRTAEFSRVVGEIACLEAECLGFRLTRECLSQFVVDFGIGGDGGTDVYAYRRGIDEFDMADPGRVDGFDVGRQSLILDAGLQAGTRLSKTNVVFPDPETPVTTMSLPFGISTDRGLTV